MVLHEADRRPTMTPTTTTSRLDRRSDGQDYSSVHSQFQFLTPSSEMCTADDVIVGGKLLPFCGPAASSAQEAPGPNPQYYFSRIRSPAVSFTGRSSSPPKARRNETHICRSSSLGDPPRGGKITGDYRKLKNPCILALGPARVPAAMELKEIRNRQRRRRPASPEGKEAAGKHAGGERRPWKLLETLSCRAMDAVVIA